MGSAHRVACKRRQQKQRRDEKRERLLKALSDYFDFQEDLKKVPPHRVLAINRGERAKALRVKIEADTAGMEKAAEELLIPPEHPNAEFLRGCLRDALSRLILPSLEREVRRELTDNAEEHAVDVFARNLLDKDYFELLSAAPGNSGLYVGLPGDPRTVGVTLRMNFR